MFEDDVFKIATRSGEAAWTRAKCGRTRAQLSRTKPFYLPRTHGAGNKDSFAESAILC